ncbi:PAS domain-containing protein [Oceaniglobus trochenteri]|uniref:PAS domain-containing protein n=1 Tax=Oceaniglobus trochenteri TaxID=2763260 RepID=UPI001CFF798E|nr:PAS domain-containing protein [Oceaniglobus trochenteri]
MAVLAMTAALIVSFGALMALNAWDRWRMVQGAAAVDPAGSAVSFLFDGPQLVDYSQAGQLLMSSSGRDIQDFSGLAGLLGQRFPDLVDQRDRLGLFGQCNLYSADRSEIATLSRHRDRLRLALAEVEAPGDRISLDRPTLLSIERELGNLRDTTENMPFLVWRQDGEGNITWVNRAYLDTCRAHGDPARLGVWPPIRLFDIDMGQIATAQRQRLTTKGDAPDRWFQFHITPLGDEFLISGMNVDTVVKAEESQRTFVQTLSKTFADLPVGLAVFTRDRRLALFNPALADLTTLAPEKLIMRPTIFGFFDMLRDLQMMPEPKDYNSWREQIVDLEASAANGTYRDTWHLPFGRTFRVTGRPQIDGAVALLFEDISDEIGMSRRFRTELEIGQSVLDSLEDGLAVFTPNGVLTLTNAAYDSLWKTETREGLDTPYVDDATRHWAALSAPSAIWGEVRDYILSDRRGEAWMGEAMLLDGRPIRATLSPVVGGSTLARFEICTDRMKPIRPTQPVARSRRATQGA